MSTRATWLTPVVVAVLLVSPAGSRADSSAMAQEYCRAHGFTAKYVEAGPQGRRVTRCYVPVTPETRRDFRDRFSAARGFLQLMLNPPTEHMALSMGSQSSILWGAEHPEMESVFFPHAAGQQLAVVNLSPAQLGNAQRWLSSGAGTQFGGHCYKYLSNVEVEPGVGLFKYLGIRRTLSAAEGTAKINHAANGNVSVIGVCVPTGGAFQSLTPADLLGRLPMEGVEAAVDR